MIDWKRVPRQGFIQSHWVGKLPDGREVSIWQRAITISRLKRRFVAELRPRGGSYDSVSQAKAAAEAMK